MAGRKAAHGGSKEDHDGKELTKGSPTVFIENRPAWRAEVDTFGCEKDGAEEKVIDGATTVHINNQLATREGDFLLGPGGPNAILAAATRTEIGESHVGIGSELGKQDFCSEWCRLKADWPNLSVEERKTRYKTMVDNVFRRLGMPPPRSYEFFRDTDPTDGITGGWWSQRDWRYAVNEDYFKGPKASNGLAEVTVHETRHGEQSWYGLRSAKHREAGPDEGWASWLLGHHDVPRAVSDAARNAPPLTPAEERYARTMYDANYTDAGTDLLNRSCGADYHKKYSKSPWGADARQVEPQASCNC